MVAIPGARVGRFLTGLLVAACLMLGMAHSAGAAGLHVIPFPGTPDATPDTDIIFSSIAPGDLTSLAVIGSRSGDHPGRLVRLSARAGAAFVPDRPFSPGEHVQVGAELRSPATAAVLGAAGRQLRYSFNVAVPVVPTPQAQDARSSARATGVPNGMSFHSAPGLHPPTVTVSGDPDQGSGDIFLTPRNSYQRQVDIQHGPMIINGRGQLVWFQQASPGTVAINLEVQTYRRHPVLTWWQGTNDFSEGFDLIANSSYRTMDVLRLGPASADYATDAHEFQITPQGTALVEGYGGVRADLTRLGGSAEGVVQDDVIQELDIKTGQVLWEWHSYGHVPLADSYIRPSGSNWFDYFHLNSIQQLPNGNLLISARNTWAIYEISKSTGRILWTLGGKNSSFPMSRATRFEWQHDAHMIGRTVSVFDDGSDGPAQEEGESSGKLLRLHMNTMTATLAHRYTHKPALLSVSQGSVQKLPNRNVFIGWGADPQFSEYTPAGKQIFDGSFVLGVNTYRAYRVPWVGRPTTPPALAVAPSSGGLVTLYASWNGATQVAAWRVLGGPEAGSLVWVARAAKTGFETTIKLGRARRYFEVQALGTGGQVLGSSPIEPDHGPG
jgi:hypothetical protein